METKEQKILHLVLKYKWFDKIKSGEKRTEFRKCSDHFNRLFKLKNRYTHVRFQRGYKKNPETMVFEIKAIHKYTGENDLKLPEVWAIHLGGRIR